ncbi:MAG: hypothetical protein GC160_00400 [Acidobacteria bacterium]|nr:hypothetical protein [Acidobacteriota bacterium]
MYRSNLTARLSRRAGQTMIMLAICVFAMLGVLGLVLDGGRIYFEKRRAQAAADAGAVAAAQEIRRGHRETSWVRGAALTDTDLNGYNDQNSTIVVNVPPSSGSRTADDNFAEVLISRTLPTTFIRAVGMRTAEINVRSVVGLLPDSFFCIYALDPDADGAFTNNGTTSFEANCGIIVNSMDAEGFRGLGTGACTKATNISIAGGYSVGCSNPDLQTTPDTGIPAVPDPLAHLPEPDRASLPMGSTTGPATDRVYSPGVYSNKIQVTSGKKATFLPGVYYLEKGLQFSGGTIVGDGVTFYNHNDQGSDVISISAAATVNINAPKTGTYMGILFFGSRDSPFSPPNHNIARGSSGSNYTGTFYFPNEHIDFAGTPAGSVGWTIIVARTMDFSGDTGAAVVNPPPPDENPLLVPIMVE